MKDSTKAYLSIGLMFGIACTQLFGTKWSPFSDEKAEKQNYKSTEKPADELKRLQDANAGIEKRNAKGLYFEGDKEEVARNQDRIREIETKMESQSVAANAAATLSR